MEARKHPAWLDRLPHLRNATVYVVEGEKDADRLVSLKLPATTAAGGGAGKWRSEYVQQLKAAGVEQVLCYRITTNRDGRTRRTSRKAVTRSASP